MLIEIQAIYFICVIVDMFWCVIMLKFIHYNNLIKTDNIKAY